MLLQMAFCRHRQQKGLSHREKFARDRQDILHRRQCMSTSSAAWLLTLLPMLSYGFYTSLPLAVLIFCLTLQLNDPIYMYETHPVNLCPRLSGASVHSCTKDSHPHHEDRQPCGLLQVGLQLAYHQSLREINLMPGPKPSLSAHGKTYTGDFLMKVGIPVLSASWMSSRVVEITAL